MVKNGTNLKKKGKEKDQKKKKIQYVKTRYWNNYFGCLQPKLKIGGKRSCIQRKFS